jgi:Icc protein
MKRYVWYSDTHLNMAALPFMKRLFVRRLQQARADGVIITGDISSGTSLESDLRFLAHAYDGPIYFVLGNHDYHRRHVESVHDDVRRLCQQHPNLHWLTDEPVTTLVDDVALVGTEGWYDAALGDPTLLRWTTDWALTLDFLHLPTMEARLERWRQMSRDSAKLIAERLEQALKHHHTVYVATHFPPWKQATRDEGKLLERFWLPYNTNTAMGEAIEKVMEGRKKRRVVVLAGHTHEPCHVRVSNAITCQVARASYLGQVNAEETIVL